MARKQVIDSIISLYKKLGGNMSDVLGTRSNISFLGKGKSAEPMLDMDINSEALAVLPQAKAIDELKSSVGYAVSDKLNDIQANRLLSNMQKMDEVYNPPAVPANVTDLATGTRNLDAEGLMSLRQGIDLPEGIDRAETILPTGAGLEAVKSVKNFEKRVADELVDKVYEMSGVKEAAKPVARGNARDSLNTIKDMEDPTFPDGPTLSSVMEADDLRFATEGGGGALGDPLLLVQKYFGPRVAAAVSKLEGRDQIETFAKNLVKIKDSKGNTITSRNFNPDDVDIDTVDVDLDYADGGRVGYMAGARVAKFAFDALRKYGIEGKDISRLFASLGTDKSLVGKEKTAYFKELYKVLKNPDDYPEAIADIQKQLGIDIPGLKGGGLAGILEV